MRTRIKDTLPLLALLVATAPAVADDFYQPAYRSAELSVFAEWEFASSPANPLDIAPDTFSSVGGTGGETLWTGVPTHAEAVNGFTDWTWVAGDGNGGLEALKSPSLMVFDVQNWIDMEERKLLRIQVTYQGLPPLITLVTGGEGPGPDPVPSFFSRHVDVDAEHYFEDWIFQPNPDFDVITMSVPFGTVIDEVIIDTFSSPFVPPDPFETWLVSEVPLITETVLDLVLPADFFESGSDPFDGQVFFQGDPFGPGATSVLVRRSADPFDQVDLPGPTESTVPIEIVELSLVSADPIEVTFGGGSPEFWDVRVDLSIEPQVAGQLTAIKNHANGGTFEALLPVLPILTFTRIAPPAPPIVLDFGVQMFPPFNLFFSNIPWVHQVYPGLDVFVQPGALWVPGVNEDVPGNPASQEPVPFFGQDPGKLIHWVCIPVFPGTAIPTVSEWGLIVIGLLLLVAMTVFLRRTAARARPVAS